MDKFTLEKEQEELQKGLDIAQAIEDGLNALRQKDYVKAERCFRQARKLDPNSSEANNGLFQTLYQAGESAFQAGKYADAVRWFEKALELEVSHAGVFKCLLESAYEAGKDAEKRRKLSIAATYFRKVLELDSAHPEARHCLEMIARKRRIPWIVGGILMVFIIIFITAQVNNLIHWPVPLCDTTGDLLCTPSPTFTTTPTVTSSPTLTPTPTSTSAPTPTPTLTPTPTETPAPTATPIPPTDTPMPTLTPTPCPPPPADWAPYTVQAQDTMFSLARKYGTDVDSILRFNNCRFSSDIRVGESLYLPAISVQVEAIVPELISPGYGTTHPNPVTFTWSGQLAQGQLYRLWLSHPDSGVTREVLTRITTATVDLPAENFGEWQWIVSVTQDGVEISRSVQGMFWFKPL